MFKRTKEEFNDLVGMIINCQNGLMSSVLQQLPYYLIFKATNWCWNNCKHCCELSGSSMPRTFIPESVITGYIDQALTDENFSREVVFTGGEIMAAYKFVGRYYVKNIINHALKSGCAVDIKTNAGWVNSPTLAPMIYSDLESIVRDQVASAGTEKDKVKHFVNFQISLSLDRFHKDAMMRDFKFIEHFAHTNIPGGALKIEVGSIHQDEQMFSELMKKIADSGIHVSELFRVNADPENSDEIEDKPIYDLNGNVVVSASSDTLFSGGRAKNIDFARQEPFPQFVFLNPDGVSQVALDSFGNVTLGENCGEKISVPWKDREKGTALPLNKIRENLLTATRQAEKDFLRQHRAMDLQVRLARLITR